MLHLKESIETIKALRMRHEYELDFRLESDNLIECRLNAYQSGFSPQKVMLPNVIKEIPATKHVIKDISF